jgi:hypothetical protein
MGRKQNWHFRSLSSLLSGNRTLVQAAALPAIIIHAQKQAPWARIMPNCQTLASMEICQSCEKHAYTSPWQLTVLALIPKEDQKDCKQQRNPKLLPETDEPAKLRFRE